MTIQAKNLKAGDVTLTAHGPTVQENTIESVSKHWDGIAVTYQNGVSHVFPFNARVEVF